MKLSCCWEVADPIHQAGFFEVIVMPTISLWQTLFPGSADQLHDQTMSNLTFWKIGKHFTQSDDPGLMGRHRSFVLKRSSGSDLALVRINSGFSNGKQSHENGSCSMTPDSKPAMQRSLSSSGVELRESPSFVETRQNAVMTFKSSGSHSEI